jgi:hypothetical protein
MSVRGAFGLLASMTTPVDVEQMPPRLKHQMIALAALWAVLPAVASASTRIEPPIYRVRLACTITGPAAASGVTERQVCDEARADIQELADGKLDSDVARVDGWKTFANPDKQKVFEECWKHEKIPGQCGSNYDLLYRGQQIPIVEINMDDVSKVDPEGLTVIANLVGGDVASSGIGVSVGIIEPAFGATPERHMTLPAVELDAPRAASLLHAKLKLALAHYFVPDTLNGILGNVVARSRR